MFDLQHIRPLAWLGAVLLAPTIALAQDTVSTTVKSTTVTQTPGPAAPVVVTPAPATAVPAPATVTVPAVIDSHQIDRFAAIRQVERDLRADTRDIVDWVILGELAHDVALDLPPGQDRPYYALSRQAYESALVLDPNNAAVRAAAQFARDQEAGLAQLEDTRKRSAQVYVAARRRELSKRGIVPMIRTVIVPAATTTVAPARTAVTTTTTAPVATPPPVEATATTTATTVAPGMTYQPYVVAGAPLTYTQYMNGFVVQATPTTPVVTVREYIQQYPPVSRRDAIRAATGVAPPDQLPR